MLTGGRLSVIPVADSAQDISECARERAEGDRGGGGHGDVPHGPGSNRSRHAGSHRGLPDSHQRPWGWLGPGGIRGPSAHLRRCLPDAAPPFSGDPPARHSASLSK